MASVIRKYAPRQELGYRIRATSREQGCVDLVATSDGLLDISESRGLYSLRALPTLDIHSLPNTSEVRLSLVQALARAVFSLADSVRSSDRQDLQVRPYLPFSQAAEDDFQIWVSPTPRQTTFSSDVLRIKTTDKEAGCSRTKTLDGKTQSLDCRPEGFSDWTKPELFFLLSNLNGRRLSLNLYPSIWSGKSSGHWVAKGDFVLFSPSASVSKHFLPPQEKKEKRNASPAAKRRKETKGQPLVADAWEGDLKELEAPPRNRSL